MAIKSYQVTFTALEITAGNADNLLKDGDEFRAAADWVSLDAGTGTVTVVDYYGGEETVFTVGEDGVSRWNHKIRGLVSASGDVTVGTADLAIPGQNGADGEDGAPGADGADGEDGAPGADGSNGVNAFTTVSAGGSVVPAIGATVTIPVFNSSWAAVGQPLFLGNGIGFYEVTAIPNGLSLTIRNLGVIGANAAPDDPIPDTTPVVPSGPVGGFLAQGEVILSGGTGDYSNPLFALGTKLTYCRRTLGTLPGHLSFTITAGDKITFTSSEVLDDGIVRVLIFRWT